MSLPSPASIDGLGEAILIMESCRFPAYSMPTIISGSIGKPSECGYIDRLDEI